MSEERDDTEISCEYELARVVLATLEDKELDFFLFQLALLRIRGNKYDALLSSPPEESGLDS